MKISLVGVVLLPLWLLAMITFFLSMLLLMIPMWIRSGTWRKARFHVSDFLRAMSDGFEPNGYYHDGDKKDEG